MSEVAVLREELSNLRTRLETLESRLTMIPSAPIQLSSQLSSCRLAKSKEKPVEGEEAISRVSFKHPRKSSSYTKTDSQTLRSCSFKVMRHLINIVDLSHVEDVASRPKKVQSNVYTSHDSTTFCSPATTNPKTKSRMPSRKAVAPLSHRKESLVLADSLHPTTDLQAPETKCTKKDSSRNPIASISPATKSKASTEPKKMISLPLKESTVRLTMEPKSMAKRLTPHNNPESTPSTSSATPCCLPPKGPHQVKLSNDLPTEDKGENCNNSQATAEISTVTRTPGNILPKVLAYDNLQLRCGRFSLLKHDPAMLDLLPISVKEK
ncbi:uncharacterized protein PGTG_19457 [Puccinia graminis f. sp. tritici CRL 75-36-700-3]|uniref:Uncharacterized protein n=1 Tax=Puccinia graminis f. sp. tritici (strain CRL 75-36-700-3 / race SCCL) TaxID=418459 RepID=E3L9J3_PUCGT|nr:uncharacterized protein PGTG_19457 [Puccinia graminis f. sp. tritici CRL 75-36-700-3]EFP93218.2 hypothetical protein PGTG_19457 [Puccinia graminis f. sp. tritici CRL 75-36-700-3]